MIRGAGVWVAFARQLLFYLSDSFAERCLSRPRPNKPRARFRRSPVSQGLGRETNRRS